MARSLNHKCTHPSCNETTLGLRFLSTTTVPFHSTRGDRLHDKRVREITFVRNKRSAGRDSAARSMDYGLPGMQIDRKRGATSGTTSPEYARGRRRLGSTRRRRCGLRRRPSSRADAEHSDLLLRPPAHSP